jgi:hypothetical protein
MARSTPMIEVFGLIPRVVISCMPMIAPKTAIKAETTKNVKPKGFFDMTWVGSSLKTSLLMISRLTKLSRG